MEGGSVRRTPARIVTPGREPSSVAPDGPECEVRGSSAERRAGQSGPRFQVRRSSFGVRRWGWADRRTGLSLFGAPVRSLSTFGAPVHVRSPSFGVRASGFRGPDRPHPCARSRDHGKRSGLSMFGAPGCAVACPCSEALIWLGRFGTIVGQFRYTEPAPDAVILSQSLLQASVKRHRQLRREPQYVDPISSSRTTQSHACDPVVSLVSTSGRASCRIERHA